MTVFNNVANGYYNIEKGEVGFCSQSGDRYFQNYFNKDKHLQQIEITEHDYHHIIASYSEGIIPIEVEVLPDLIWYLTENNFEHIGNHFHWKKK